MLLISCRRASELVHKKHNHGLSRSDALRLKVHTSMCTACKTLEKQNEQIEQVIKTRINETTPSNLEEFKVDTVAKITEE
ncbi:MAG: hypothetical protein ACI9NN_000044 [Bacteroidia bacterium]|jgi:hypothetical protein